MGVKLRLTLPHLGGLFLAAAIATLAGCATPPTNPAARAEFEATNDPLEPLNRKIFSFNLFVDRILIKPAAQGYRAIVPQFGRNAIRNFLDNLGEPVIFVNNVLQGQFGRANLTAGRFLMNSIYGVGGLFDPASTNGAPRQIGDFGQTLYSWGIPDGPYLVLPIFGPSDVRDAIGLGVDDEMDPFDWYASTNGYSGVTYGRWAVWGIDERSRNIESFDELQRNAIDFYAELRSLWRQHRASQLRNGKPPPMPDLDTLYNDPDDSSQGVTTSGLVQPLNR